MGFFQSNCLNCHIYTNVKSKWKSGQREGHGHLTKNKTFQSNSFVVFWQKWYYIYWTMIEKWGRARLSRVWNVESSAQHHQSVIYQSAVGADEGNNRIMQWWLHLQTKVPEDCAKISTVLLNSDLERKKLLHPKLIPTSQCYYCTLIFINFEMFRKKLFEIKT